VTHNPLTNPKVGDKVEVYPYSYTVTAIVPAECPSHLRDEYAEPFRCPDSDIVHFDIRVGDQFGGCSYVNLDEWRVLVKRGRVVK
jgi:hypothetical protein